MPQQELLEKILDRVTVNEDSSCWEYTGCKNNSGYSCITYAGKSELVHRIVCAWGTGKPIPPDSQVHHLCGNRGCCRPDHLQVLSIQNHALVKDSYVALRYHRVMLLWNQKRDASSTEIGRWLTMDPKNVVKYLENITRSFDHFSFQVIQAKKGSRPAMFRLQFAPEFLQDVIAFPEVPKTPAYSPLFCTQLVAA